MSSQPPNPPNPSRYAFTPFKLSGQALKGGYKPIIINNMTHYLMGFRPPLGGMSSAMADDWGLSFFDELSNMFDKQTNFYVTVRNEWHSICVITIGEE